MVDDSQTDGDPPGRTALYRLRDSRGHLLYVGITSSPENRWLSHEQTKSWWPNVVSRDLTWFDDRESAAAAEVAAIKTELPRFNHSHKPSPLHERLEPVDWARYDATQRHPLDRHLVIASVLRNAVLDGDIKPGERFPSVPQLIGHFGVSTTAIQNALSVLKEEGFAVGRKGAGVYAAQPTEAAVVPLAAIGAGGNEAAVVEAVYAPAPANVAHLLGIERGSPVRTERWVRSEGGRPVEFVTAYGYEEGRPLTPARSVRRVRAITPTIAVFKALELDTNSPVLAVMSADYDASDRCIGVKSIVMNGNHASVEQIITAAQ
ncbi:GntR family transcriptional regulator [Kitasatospora sp. NPDC127116]|uniref:GntR family transcriptional regulator n=1 Tax=Kitasatospora sp. NPDC127116 TaxID=3345367 RepID=UPI00364333BC